MMTACLSVNARDPTDVPIAFATSFAPMFQAMYAQTIKASPIVPGYGFHELTSNHQVYIATLMYIYIGL